MLEAGAASIAELFTDYLDDASDGRACITLTLSSRGIDETARNAIEKSFAALGYGDDVCTYATLSPREGERATGEHLDAQAVFLLVEGLDPLCVIAADEEATRMLGEAYRTTYELNSAIRVFGRPSVAFQDLSMLLETPEGKQKAWHLIKSIPKR